MMSFEQRRDAVRLPRDGWPDEAVERLTALSLDQLVELRAEAAARPFDRLLDGPPIDRPDNRERASS